MICIKSQENNNTLQNVFFSNNNLLFMHHNLYPCPGLKIHSNSDHKRVFEEGSRTFS